MKKFLVGIGKAIGFLLVYFGTRAVTSLVFFLIGAAKMLWSDGAHTAKRVVEAGELFAESYAVLIYLISSLLVVCFIVAICGNKRGGFAGRFGLKKIDAVYLLFCVITGFSASITVTCLINILPISEELAREYGANISRVLVGGTLLIVITDVIAMPVAEEFVFRAVVLDSLDSGMSRKLAVFLSSIAFAYVHVNVIQMVYAFAMGIFFCQANRWGRSVWPSIFMHISYNSAGIILSITGSARPLGLPLYAAGLIFGALTFAGGSCMSLRKR